MKKKNVVIIIALLVLTVGLCACNNTGDLDTFVEYMNDSAQKANSVNSVIQMYDGDTLVYKYERTIEISGNSAVIEISESKLNSSFKLDTLTTYEQEQNIDRNTLIPVSLAKSSLTNYAADKNGFTSDISAENFASVLKLGSYKITGSATLSCSFSSKTLTEIDCGFKTEGGKTVSIHYIYSY